MFLPQSLNQILLATTEIPAIKLAKNAIEAVLRAQLAGRDLVALPYKGNQFNERLHVHWYVEDE